MIKESLHTAALLSFLYLVSTEFEPSENLLWEKNSTPSTELVQGQHKETELLRRVASIKKSNTAPNSQHPS